VYACLERALARYKIRRQATYAHGTSG